MNFDRPHRRLNLLTGEWVLVSPHRARRPWLGQVEKVPPERLPQYDPECYLCPGNKRSVGVQNPPYTGTFVFDNDFAALLLPEDRPGSHTESDLFIAEEENGICRVICFSPRHDLTIPEMSQGEVEAVIDTWIEQTLDLGGKPFIQYVQIFENKGAMMGASNPHPHSQVWATSHIPNQPAVELRQQEAYAQKHHSCLLCDYLKAEQSSGERIVCSNEFFTALVPFWAVWPFEILLISHDHVGSMPDLNLEQRQGLADILRQITIRYDNLFEISFPYSMGFHQTPSDGKSYPFHHFHAHYYPPLLRSATVRKFMVGFEMLGMPQRDLTPETAAQRLRDLPAIHYKNREPD
ncbi:MAG: UDP-glucose--hexose-1-phosphate uridylyltransferase [Anaerolinea sp.]